jgi:ribonuclease HII
MHIPTKRQEHTLRAQGFSTIAGVDEAGRGALAGPLYAAAVIMPPDLCIPGVRDSKLLAENAREALFEIIVQRATAWAVARIPETEIDRTGIGQANLRALADAVTGLALRPEYVLVDGFSIALPMPSTRVIHGDTRVFSIACASIIAKVSRDREMRKLRRAYPRFAFHRHKGYGTLQHRQELTAWGPTPVHRQSFRFRTK